ncbi:unnamed protein product, partial [Ectocarpus sp. 12 AP-2014]
GDGALLSPLGDRQERDGGEGGAYTDGLSSKKEQKNFRPDLTDPPAYDFCQKNCWYMIAKGTSSIRFCVGILSLMGLNVNHTVLCHRLHQSSSGRAAPIGNKA